MYNSLSEVLDVLDHKWELSLLPDSDTEYVLSPIEYKGFDFKIAIYVAKYRIEHDGFILNSNSRKGLKAQLERIIQEGNLVLPIFNELKDD